MWRWRRPAWRGAGYWVSWGRVLQGKGELAGIFPAAGQRIGLGFGKKLDSPGAAAAPQPLGRKAGLAPRLDDVGDGELVGLGRGGGEGQRDLPQPQLEEAVSAPRLAVVVALRRGPAQYLDLASVEPEPLIDGRDLRLGGTLVRKEDSRRAAFDDGRRDAAGLDIGQALRREHDARVLLPQGLEPFAELGCEVRAVEDQPTLIDDDERGRAVQPAFDPVEQVGQDGGRRARAYQPP